MLDNKININSKVLVLAGILATHFHAAANIWEAHCSDPKQESRCCLKLHTAKQTLNLDWPVPTTRTVLIGLNGKCFNKINKEEFTLPFIVCNFLGSKDVFGCSFNDKKGASVFFSNASGDSNKLVLSYKTKPGATNNNLTCTWTKKED